MNRRNIALLAFGLTIVLAVALLLTSIYSPGRGELLRLFYFPALMLSVILSANSHLPGPVALWVAYSVYTLAWWIVLVVLYAMILEAYIIHRELRRLDLAPKQGVVDSDAALRSVSDAVHAIERRRRGHWFLLAPSGLLNPGSDKPEMALAHLTANYGRDRTTTKVLDRIHKKFGPGVLNDQFRQRAHQLRLNAIQTVAKKARTEKLSLGELPASNTADAVRSAERTLLFGDNARPIDEPQGVGLAFSGGGIRSASFGLGALQALFRFGVFERFDYLSTVSGGGYLGAAISWWRRRYAADKVAFRQQFGSAAQPLGEPVSLNPSRVWLDYIRSHSKYLTPGKLSDLSLVGTVLRGASFNLLIYGAVLVAFVTWLLAEGVLPAVVDGKAELPGYSLQYWALLCGLTFAVSVGLYAIATWICSLSNLSAVIVGTGVMVAMAATCVLLQSPDWLGGVLPDSPGNWTVTAALALVWFYAVPDYWRLLKESYRKFTCPKGKDSLPSHTWQYIARVRYQAHLGAFCGGSIGVLLLWSVPYAWHAINSAVSALAAAGVSTIMGISGGVYQFLMGRSKSSTESFGSGLRIILSAGLLIYGLLLLSYHLAFGIYALPTWMLAVATLLGCAALAGTVINTNYFGLGRMYRDRLMETFMPNVAAVEQCRWDNASEGDEASLIHFRYGLDNKLQRPLHLVNCNVVMVDALTDRFRGRGGDSFVLSPWYSGSDATGWVPTERLGDGSLTLATAVAISGAAINPDGGVAGQGITRNRLVSFMLSLLNIRLGYWLPNPARPREPLRSFAPNLWLPGVMQGLLGRGLNEQAMYVEATDGGHFDNTALYEMVRRRVKTIVVCEAGQDQKYQMADIANAIERVRADFGVHIQFNLEEWGLTHIRPDKKTKLAVQGFSIGTIQYPGTSELGALLYVQLAPISAMPPDIDSYRRRYPEFPNQSTADQFFEEEQLEAYRELGLKTMHQALELLKSDTSPVLTALRTALLDGASPVKMGETTPPTH